ncbi:hypothetical protein H5410_020819 [Solanum commersonii]|uniref:Uncharacterized protein n=1 Tax=Solanum commersonii TaxID=4109 RepID=A0A9J5ZA70_SOLCO|nr:hypothetical protein H5410_020819 [Solanum commersonii]
MGRDINEFELISEYIKPSSIAREAKEVYYERNIIVSEEDLLLQKKLNTEQRKAYDIILDRVLSNKFGAFYIDGPVERYNKTQGIYSFSNCKFGVAPSLLPRRSNRFILDLKFLLMSMKILLAILVNKVH